MNTKIAAIQAILGVKQDGIWGPISQGALDLLVRGEGVAITTGSGKGSWFSQYVGKFTWVDLGDQPNSNALGVPDDKQGIALPSRTTLGKWFNVTAPNGVTLLLQQTDLGPAVWTGRKIDIAAVAAERFGYSPMTFPTNGIFTWEPEVLT